VADPTRRRQVRAAARRAPSTQPRFDGWLRLESSGWYVQVSDVVNEDAAASLVGDDTVWRFAVEEWRHRRPSVFRRAQRRAWRAEEDVLATQACLLVEATKHLRTLRPMSDAAG
jgi:hypothetical protein